jgi:hypothetical protein
VLLIGAARYAFLLAGWLIPWLRAPLPPRFWRKVVAAVQGVVLTVAASGVTSRLTGMIAVGVALLLLAESFGHDVIWLYRAGASARLRLTVRITTAALAFILLWFALVAPDRTWQFSLGAFVRIPIELLVLVAVALVLPPWPRRILAIIAGILIGVLTVVKILNIAYYQEVDRAFNPVSDWVGIGQARGVIQDAIGNARTNLVLIGAVIALALLLGAIIVAPFAASLLSPPSGGCPRAWPYSSSRALRSPRTAPPGWPSRRSRPPRQRSPTRVSSRRPPAPPIPRPPSPPRTC